jgi:hypothetical protein
LLVRLLSEQRSCGASRICPIAIIMCRMCGCYTSFAPRLASADCGRSTDICCVRSWRVSG